MANGTATQEQVRPRTGNGEEQQRRPADLAPKVDVAMTTQGLMPRDIDQAWRYANALAKSTFVPQQYQDKPGDCLIAIDISMRLGVHPLAFLQNSYVVHGRPGMEAKLIITLINKSGLFTDPLDYEVMGDDPFAKDYRVRAFAKRKSTGKVLYGPWISWKVVAAEAWDKKPGSKWLTMPEVMFHYRAASWFANQHCPEIKMGMDTTDELADMGETKHVDSVELKPTNGRQKFGFEQPQAPFETRPATDKEVEDELNDRDDSAAFGPNPPAESQPAAEQGEPTEPGLYTCTGCGWTGDRLIRGGACPGCRTKGNIQSTEDLKELAADPLGPGALTESAPAFECDECGRKYLVKPAQGHCLGTDDGSRCLGNVVEIKA